MKYSVLDFCVVSTKSNDEEHFFICKRGFFTSTYIEFFTNKKIKSSSISWASPLYKFYSESQEASLSTFENFYLSKKEILDKYIEINEAYRKNPNKKNPYGDKNYTMKNSYNADDLVVAEFVIMDEECQDLATIKLKQKYLCEKIDIEGIPKFREVFTGFITDTSEFELDDEDNLPRITTYVPLTDVIPEVKGLSIPKLSLILLMNDINHQKITNKNVKKKNKRGRK